MEGIFYGIFRHAYADCWKTSFSNIFMIFQKKKTSSSVTAFFISTADMLGLRKLLMSYYTAKHFVLCAMKAKMYFLA